ncbi:hypothetical protein PUN28_010161 [Cardiocondyla obscurior]|uniref:Ribosomal protein S14 n=1 Tax=Cardiocondyla obscurior TaxID=286306 RepID=A0AAW2FMD2_9HYME
MDRNKNGRPYHVPFIPKIHSPSRRDSKARYAEYIKTRLRLFSTEFSQRFFFFEIVRRSKGCRESCRIKTRRAALNYRMAVPHWPSLAADRFYKHARAK